MKRLDGLFKLITRVTDVATMKSNTVVYMEATPTPRRSDHKAKGKEILGKYKRIGSSYTICVCHICI